LKSNLTPSFKEKKNKLKKKMNFFIFFFIPPIDPSKKERGYYFSKLTNIPLL
jgi:hypothetical protein